MNEIFVPFSVSAHRVEPIQIKPHTNQLISNSEIHWTILFDFFFVSVYSLMKKTVNNLFSRAFFFISNEADGSDEWSPTTDGKQMK